MATTELIEAMNSLKVSIETKILNVEKSIADAIKNETLPQDYVNHDLDDIRKNFVQCFPEFYTSLYGGKIAGEIAKIENRIMMKITENAQLEQDIKRLQEQNNNLNHGSYKEMVSVYNETIRNYQNELLKTQNEKENETLQHLKTILEFNNTIRDLNSELLKTQNELEEKNNTLKQLKNTMSDPTSRKLNF